MYQNSPPIVCDRFACESVLEVEFVSILNWYATHGKGQEGDMAIA